MSFPEGIRNTAQIKQYNIDLIRKYLARGIICTKKEISENTGLSLATCSVLLSEMIEKDQVSELEFAAPKGGRPARKLCLNADYQHIMCLYMENNAPVPGIKMRVFDLTGHVLHERFLVSPGGGIAAGTVRTLVSDTLSAFPKIKTLSIGIPGYCNKQNVVEHCDFEGLVGVDLKSLIEKEFGISVIIGNDMYFTSYGFYVMSDHPKPFSLTVSLWPDNKLAGAGSVIDGKALLGSTRFAGEIGNLPYAGNYASQREMIQTQNDITPFVGTYLVSNIAILDPDIIYVTGNATRNINHDRLRSFCLNYIPENHIPEIHFQNDIEEEYMRGLFEIACEQIRF